MMFGLGVTSGPEDYGVFDEDNYSDRDLGVFVDNEFVEKEEEWGGEARPSEERGAGRRLERSDSKSITLPSYKTYNLPDCACL